MDNNLEVILLYFLYQRPYTFHDFHICFDSDIHLIIRLKTTLVVNIHPF